MNVKDKKGVDVSPNNGKTSIEKIKAGGYDFAMIHAGLPEIETEE